MQIDYRLFHYARLRHRERCQIFAAHMAIKYLRLIGGPLRGR